MKKILITTIMRNQQVNINQYFSMLRQLVELSDYDFYISIYENDSKDRTKQILMEMNYNSFKLGNSIVCQNINSAFYPPGNGNTSLDRVTNLANARNKALFPIKEAEWDMIISIQGDVIYDPYQANQFIKSIPENFHVYSGMSMIQHRLYDTWCTRNNQYQQWFSGFNSDDYLYKLYATYSGFCVYNGILLKRHNIMYLPYDQILNKVQAQPVMVCKQFQRLQLDNIYMDKRFIIRHLI